MMKVLKILVGFVIVFIILSIFSEEPSRYSTLGELGVSSGVGVAFFLIFWSIVCTLGISLVFWIPLWFAVGWVVFEGVVWISENLGAKPAGDAQQPKTRSAAFLPREDQALISYIKKAREKGLTNEEIRANLRNNGWLTLDIMWAFEKLK